MDCALGSQYKRRLEGDLDNWEHFCPPKKLCDGIGVYSQTKCSMMTDCPVNTWEIRAFREDGVNKIGSQDPKMVCSVPGGGPGQCVRCMAGESGHINHIMECISSQLVIFQE